MNLTSKRAGHALVLTVAGGLDAEACNEFHVALMPLVTAAIADGADVVLDFADVHSLHDFGRRTLMLAAKACRSTTSRIAIASLQPALQEKHDVAKFDLMIPSFRTATEAVAALAANRKIRAFEESVLLPALTEITESPRLLEDYTAEVVAKRPHPDAVAEELLASLSGAFRRRAGPSLLLSSRERPDGVSALAGRYVMTVLYDVDGDKVFASPGVILWMRFNNKLHVFDHRYAHDAARYPVEDVTRKDVFNHVLGSFDFFKLHALSDQAFPGYC